MNVLQSWCEVGECIGVLKEKGRVLHPDHTKNWDMRQISEMLDRLPKDAAILDMGCSGSVVLEHCFKAGYTNATGIDLKIPVDRVKQVLSLVRNGFRLPYRLARKDMTDTGFAKDSFDFLISLSVIEHGVPIEPFLKESYRLLKKGGQLYVSTDYWDRPLRMQKEKIYGLGWRIYSKKDIEKLAVLAEKVGFKINDRRIPDVKKRVCWYRGYKYTFISMVLEK